MEVTGKKHTTKERDKHCEPCAQEHKTKVADGFCEQCEEYMCQTCFEHHIKGKASRGHKLVGKDQVPLSADKGKTRKCQKHTSKSVKFFCKEHNFTGCGDCMLLEHRQCALDYIQDIAENYPKSREYTEFKSKIDSAYMKVENRLSKITENTTAVANTQKKITQQIKQFRKEINSLLDEAETALGARVKEYESEDISRLSKLEHEVRDLKTKLLEVKDKVDNSCGVDLFMTAIKYEAVPDMVEEKLASIDYQTDVEDFIFIAGAELKKFVQSAGSLGIVRRKAGGQVLPQKPSASQWVLQSDFLNAVREVYECLYETVQISNDPEVRAFVTAEATVAAFAAAREGHFHPRVIEIHTTEERLGFNLRGGQDEGSPVFVSGIIPGSVSDCAGLKRGDRLIFVNGVPMEGVTHEEAIYLIREAQGKLKLIVTYSPSIMEQLVASDSRELKARLDDTRSPK